MQYKFHLLFLLFCVLTLAYAPSLEYGLRMMAKLSAPFLFLIVIMLAVNQHNQLLLIQRTILISSLIVVTLGVAGKLSGLDPEPRFNLLGVGPATTSANLVVAGMLALALYVKQRRPIMLLLVCIIAAAVIGCFTRITIAAMFVGFSVIMFLGTRGLKRAILPIAGIIGLPTLFLFNAGFRSRMFIGGDQLSAQNVIDSPMDAIEHVHGSGRFGLWQEVLHKFFDPSPLVGSGVGATQQFLYTHTSGGGIGVTHSEYVRLLAEVGIIGSVLFVLAVSAYLLKLFSNHWRTGATENEQTYALAAIGGLIAYLIFIATDNGFNYVSQFAIYVFGLIALSEKSRELSSVPAPAVDILIPVDLFVLKLRRFCGAGVRRDHGNSEKTSNEVTGISRRHQPRLVVRVKLGDCHHFGAHAKR